LLFLIILLLSALIIIFDSTFIIIIIFIKLIIISLYFHGGLKCLHLIFDFDIFLHLLLNYCAGISKVYLLCCSNDRNVLFNYLLLVLLIIITIEEHKLPVTHKRLAQ